jgi:hypothetical protein
LQQSIRLSVDQIADSLQFGPPTAIYQQVFSPATKRRKYWAMVIYSVAIMVFPSCEFIGPLLSTPKQPVLIIIGTITFALFGIFTLILVLILMRRMTRPWYVFLYTEGFLSVIRRKVEAARWDQVISIRQFFQFGFSQDTIRLADGRKFTFDSTFLNLETVPLLSHQERDLPLAKLDRLGDPELTLVFARWEEAKSHENELLYVMEREILTRLTPKMIATYHQGLPVTFGKLRLSTMGIRSGKLTLLWDEVDQITFRGEEGEPIPENNPFADEHTLIERLAWWQNEITSSDTILITRKGQRDVFWSREIALVPNAFILMVIASHALRQRQ